MNKHSTTFWIVFWIAAVVFLFGWYAFWEFKNRNVEDLGGLVGLLPETETKDDLRTVITIADALLYTNGETKTFLLLFQNNLELRPGGGFIGSFAILKVRDGSVTAFEVHDSGNFDGRIPDTVPAPYPMPETLKVKAWKLRDSNYSPDWMTNAEKAVEFYRLGQGEESFDGVIGITTNVLASFLKVTGPVEVPGYPGVYGPENAVLDLEYQVEQGFVEQNIARGERKTIMNALGRAVLDKAKDLSLPKKYELFKTVLEDLHRKDIQIAFKDKELQRVVENAGWGGIVDRVWQDDYLMVVDANLSALKTDYRMKRSIDYSVDLRPTDPTVTATVTYTHTAKTKDYMTRDYQTYLRLYVPEGSWLQTVSGNAKPAVYGSELGKKTFGVLVQVPLGTTKSVTFQYTLPKNIDASFYDLKIQKQAGVNDVPVHLKITEKDGSIKEKDFTLNRDTTLGMLEG